VSLHREPTSETWGVEPDIDVELAQKERINIWKMRREAERIGPPKPEGKDEDVEKDDAEGSESVKGADADDAKDGKADEDDATAKDGDEKEKLPPIKQPDENDRPMVDPQMDTALLVMRLHLLADEYPTLAAATVKEPNGKTANP